MDRTSVAAAPLSFSTPDSLPSWLARWVIPLALATSAAAQPVLAGETAKVQFDVAPLVACREVTPREFAYLHPHEKLVEARLEISSLLVDGRASDLVQFLYRIDSPQRTAEVVDYLPRTTLASDVVGNLDVERKEQLQMSASINVGGAYQELVKGGAVTSASRSLSDDLKYARLPPLELLAASGTVGRGSGVYFKLRPSTQTSLEGSREFMIVLRVPRTWRGDRLQVVCEATTRGELIVPSIAAQDEVRRTSFVVALYLEGDMQAQMLAADMIEAESRLRTMASAQRREIERRSFPTLVHRLGAVLSVVEPKIDPRWCDELMARPADGRLTGVERYLPEEVRAAARTYVERKAELHRLTR